ncbi:hypothetical protein K461DRAFT_286443 [Myriangium duriaei CBS 260.36]|uniref:Zn(2)-C6 fungal-type domain-containing protein n=1 Tax=Myriangium duriaei CBS 260.36 TaxID=1168546 RepID=A0A9P4IZ63_9PEZI|nr:hypothetical protein K461DRAFT_286443 [Myriangium duriaei CBS 260.36]
MTLPESSADNAAQDQGATAPKPKRVRTGCLTCRERHLKCDEGVPTCLNCKKSSRICKRGLRLNFIDTQTKAPPKIVQAVGFIGFEDESRNIASEYKGGLERYGVAEEYDNQANGFRRLQAHNQQHHDQSVIDPSLQFDHGNAAPPAPSMSYQELPPIQGMLPDSAYSEDPQAMLNQIKFDQPKYDHATESYQRHNSTVQSPFSSHNAAHSSAASFGNSDQESNNSGEKKEYLNNQEEVLFMQVFVEEVGLWMDSMDPMKHFSRLLPFHSLQEPMLLNAFLACGARHLTLINPIYTEEKALYYYDTATRHLLKALQNPNRDTVICATTAVILNVYEIMSERALQRMNHIAGARALIKECGWNARATGIGSACFWLNVGLEVLSCLHFNWQVAWDPDDWGVDMDFSREIHNGREEIWTHRMLYIVGKVCNFRATIPRFQEADPRDEDLRKQNRYNDWQRLKGWADAWNENIPRTMHPMAFLYPNQTTSKSAFPEVWLIKRSTIVARLFYHTVMLLLAQIHPYLPADHPEMWEMQKQHSQMVCGISAHVKDRGVASVALRSLAHAAECLTSRREQEEVLQIFTKINKETGWRIAFVFKELKERWGWKADDPSGPQVHITSNSDPKVRTVGHQPGYSTSSAASASPSSASFSANYGQQQTSPFATTKSPAQGGQSRGRPPSGIMNPMYATADFSMPQHPYHTVYVPPNHPGQMQAAFPAWGGVAMGVPGHPHHGG